MQTLEELQKEIKALKAKLQTGENKLKTTEIRVEGLTKLNQWYIEQLKLSRQKGLVHLLKIRVQ